MPQLDPATEKLVEQYRSWHQSLKQKEDVSTIQVDEVASRVAAFYEKIRGVIDWKEEHLMKRAAIERKLKRRIVMAEQGKDIAESLILELIRGGHFPNNKIPESRINQVEKVLNKYIYILEKSNLSSSKKRRVRLYNWLLGIAACEIEEILSASKKERALIDYMTSVMAEKIKIRQKKAVSVGPGLLNEEEKNRQVYIACQRALFKLDAPIITYHLLKNRYQDWADLSQEKLAEISQRIYAIWQSLEDELSHPLKDKFYKICEKYDTPYLLIGDILTEEDPGSIYDKLNNPEKLVGLIKQAYLKRLSTLKKRLSRAAFYSTLSILITNSVALFILEVPLAKLIMGTFSYTAIAVDILGPTFLMFLLIVTIRPPSKNNLELVIMEVMKIVYRTNENDVYEIKALPKKGLLMKSLIVLLYIIGAIVTISLIVAVLRLAGLPPTSYVVNVMFVAIIAFTGLALRNKGEELTVEEKKVGVIHFLFDILFLPIVSLGRWLSTKWKKYNAIAVFFNALVDFPFEIFVEFLEQWRYFLKEKKEEIY